MDKTCLGKALGKGMPRPEWGERADCTELGLAEGETSGLQSRALLGEEKSRLPLAFQIYFGGSPSGLTESQDVRPANQQALTRLFPGPTPPSAGEEPPGFGGRGPNSSTLPAGYLCQGHVGGHAVLSRTV